MTELKKVPAYKKSKNTSGEFMSIVLSNVTSEGDLNTHNIHNYTAVCTMCVLFVAHWGRNIGVRDYNI